MARVWVAMSGGVDSSVAAALLVESGHEVTGVTMQLWPSGDDEGGCCSVGAARDARRVCDALGIAHYTLNFRDSFERHVVGPFADSYAQGLTPNPCIACNDLLKFADLLAKVRSQGADALATGHYARIERDASGRPWLSRGLDPRKDQSYFLYRLTRPQMEHVLFPVGKLAKTDVREVAARIGLPTASRPESQDTCFASAGDHAPVVIARCPEAAVPGDFVDDAGRVIGRHRGLAYYTVGQRKGLGIGGPEGPWYVISLDAKRNRVVVGPLRALATTRVRASEAIWLGEQREDCVAQVRYRMRPVPAAVDWSGTELDVSFQKDVGAVAPGQSVVCYRGDTVLGGGVIACAS